MITDAQRAKRMVGKCEHPLFPDCQEQATTIVAERSFPLNNWRCCDKHAAMFGKHAYDKRKLKARGVGRGR